MAETGAWTYVLCHQSLHQSPWSLLFPLWSCCLVAKLCPTLCDPMDYNLPGSSVHGISQSRILEWVAIPFSRGSSWPRDRTHISCIGRWILDCWARREAYQSHQVTLPPGDSKSVHEEADQMFSSCSESSDLENSHGEAEGNTPYSEETSWNENLCASWKHCLSVSCALLSGFTA